MKKIKIISASTKKIFEKLKFISNQLLKINENIIFRDFPLIRSAKINEIIKKFENLENEFIKIENNLIAIKENLSKNIISVQRFNETAMEFIEYIFTKKNEKYKINKFKTKNKFGNNKILNLLERLKVKKNSFIEFQKDFAGRENDLSLKLIDKNILLLQKILDEKILLEKEYRNKIFLIKNQRKNLQKHLKSIRLQISARIIFMSDNEQKKFLEQTIQ